MLRSPLHYAVQGGLTRIVQCLLDYDTYIEGKLYNSRAQFFKAYTYPYEASVLPKSYDWESYERSHMKSYRKH